MRVCAPRSCVDDQDCPAGLVCDPDDGCGRLGSDAGGVDGGVLASDGSVLPAPGPGLDTRPAVTFDGPAFGGGGSSDGGVP